MFAEKLATAGAITLVVGSARKEADDPIPESTVHVAPSGQSIRLPCTKSPQDSPFQHRRLRFYALARRPAPPQAEREG